jgi:AcrR family transcriptional regulator
VARPREYDDELRRRLIEAAARLLVSEGLPSVSVRRVASEVGTSTTAIYSLLGGKAGLLRAIFVEGFQRLADHLAAVPAHDDPMEHLAALGLAYHRSALVDPHLYRVMFDCPTPEFQLEPEDVTLALSTLQVLVDAVQRAVDAQLLPGPADQVAVELWAMNHGITSLALSGMLPDGRPPSEHLHRMFEVALHGYGALLTTPQP